MIRLLDLETSDVIRSFYAKVDQDMPGEADGSDAIADLSWQTDKFATLDPIAKVRSAGDLLKSMPGLAALPQPRSR